MEPLRPLAARLAHPPRVLRWATAAVAVAALLLYFDVGDIAASLRGVDWRLAAPAIAILVALHAVAALTWRWLVSILSGTAMTAAFSLRAYYAGQALGGITPGNLGADAYRAHATHTHSSGWSKALLPIVVQRLGSYAALAAAGLVAGFFVPVAPVTRLVLAVLAAASLLVIALAWTVRARKSPLSIERGRALARGGLVSIGSGLVFHGIAVAATFVILRSVTGEGGVAALVGAIVLARVTTLLPLTPNGIGLQEAALAALLTKAGVPGEAALAASALSRLAMLLTMGAGFALIAAGNRPCRTNPSVVPHEA